MKYLAMLLVLLLPLAFAQLQEGEDAFLPEVTDSYGNVVDFAELNDAGYWVALWFYPKAFTNGCSLQGARYSDLNETLLEAGIQAFGVSGDDAETQCEFVETLAENGRMIPDTERVIAEAYGVIGGLFFSRDTVLINPDGQVEKIWRTVDPVEDADRVLEYVLANPQ